MKKTILLWVIATVITLVSAIYQRVTGPTYPLSGEVNIDGQLVKYKLQRSDDVNSKIIINVKGEIEGNLFWKRYKTDDDWTKVKMQRSGDTLSAFLPLQPPAGKLEYFLELSDVKIPKEKNVVIRFKGKVPIWILIPHVIAMFGAMLLSTRTGLEFFRKEKDNLLKLTYWTIGFILIGGFLLGPAVQLYAFGAWWTGIPFGTDLTDNKTLIALVGWLVALFMYKRSNKPKLWAAGAAIVMFIVYLIPHSVLGSELDYNKLDKQQNKLETSQTELL